MKVSYLGTTMLLFDDGKDQILFDCHTTRPSLLKCGLGKFSTNEQVATKVIDDFKINRLKGIFISHTHHDHVLDAPYFALKCNANLYGSKSAKNVAIGGNVPENKIFCYEDNMFYTIGDFKITIIPSIHSIAHWYNDDLGQIIDKPLKQPAKKKAYKEGGSFDFYIEHTNQTYLIRPSYNYLENQLDHYQADILFLGLGGMSKDAKERKETFFKETIDKVQPKIVIPVHWDNFFAPLFSKPVANIGILGNNKQGLDEVSTYCINHHIQFIFQQPLTTIQL